MALPKPAGREMPSQETRVAIRRAATDLMKIKLAPDSDRADGLVTSEDFSGHKTLAALSSTAYLGQFTAMLLDELEAAERCIAEVDAVLDSSDASVHPDKALDRIQARIYEWRAAS